eukprot:jgi/Orpsp1_1/1182876/evm.model.c7180000083014.1
MNPVLESLFKHKSIRKYKNQPLEHEKLDLIIKAAQAAPNWCNAQHVSIIAEKSDKFIKQLDNLFVGAHDVGIAMNSAIVAAESMGLGTVCIGSIRIKSLDVVKELNLPKYVIPMVGLCVGYPDDDPGLKPRLPAKAVCFEDRYDTSNIKATIDEYDEQYQKYLSSRDSNDRDSNWTKSVYGIYSNLIGVYDNDFELLKQQGFYPVEKK